MPDAQELTALLAGVSYRAINNSTEGLTPFRHLLEMDRDGVVVTFLEQALDTLAGGERAGIAFVLAEHYRKTGHLTLLQNLYALDDPQVKGAVLNGLWGEPGASPEMGPGIVALAIEGAAHPAPGVRTEASFVFQNQCAWGVDVTAALGPLLRLLGDPEWRVRHQAAYATGNVAKRKYDLTPHIAPLTLNLAHENLFVRAASAWALRQLSRRHNIAPAIGALAHILASDDDYNAPRKRAAGALLYHARKSAENLKAVKGNLASVSLNPNYKEVARFLKQLTEAG